METVRERKNEFVFEGGSEDGVAKDSRRREGMFRGSAVAGVARSNSVQPQCVDDAEGVPRVSAVEVEVGGTDEGPLFWDVLNQLILQIRGVACFQ